MVGILLAAGWLLMERNRRDLSKKTPLYLGVVMVVGGFIAAALLPVIREFVDNALRSGDAQAYYPTVALAVLMLGSPFLLPLGAFAHVALCQPRKMAWISFLLGSSVGLLLSPYLGEVLLGRQVTLQTCALLGGCAAVLMSQAAPLVIEKRRLLKGSPLLLLTAAGAITLLGRLLLVIVDRSGLGLPLLIAATTFGAALGAVFPGRWASWALVGWILGSGAFFDAAGTVTSFGNRDLIGDLFILSLAGIPFGVLIGALTNTEGRGITHGWTPLLLVVPVPIVLWLALPQIEPWPLSCLLAGLAGIGALRCGKPQVASLLAMTVGLLPLLTGSTLDLSARHLSLGRHLTPNVETASVRDPLTDRTLLAIDGKAPFGRSALQERRLIHLPLLLGGSSTDRLLVVHGLHGEEVRAVLDHDVVDPLDPAHQPPFVWSLWTFPPPPGYAPEPVASNVFPSVASERQFLLQHENEYDAIILAPDPRSRRRLSLTSTEEFFALAKTRLAEGGLLCQWWDLANVDVTDMKSAVASAHRVFEDVYLLLDHPRTRHGIAGILCLDRPLSLSPEDIDATLATKPRVAEDLARIGLDGFMIACLPSSTPGMLELMAPKEDGLTDDRPRLAIVGGLRSLAQPKTLQVGMNTWAARRGAPTLWLDLPREDEAEVSAHVRDVLRGWQHLFGQAQQTVLRSGIEVPPFDMEAPGGCDAGEAVGFLEALASLPDWDYLVDQITSYAQRLEETGDRTGAESYLRQAIAKDESSPHLRYLLGTVIERGGDLDDAIELYQTALFFDPTHVEARKALERLASRD